MKKWKWGIIAVLVIALIFVGWNKYQNHKENKLVKIYIENQKRELNRLSSVANGIMKSRFPGDYNCFFLFNSNGYLDLHLNNVGSNPIRRGCVLLQSYEVSCSIPYWIEYIVLDNRKIHSSSIENIAGNYMYDTDMEKAMLLGRL